MTHDAHIDHLLQDYLDGTLPTDLRQTVETHLPTCAACRAEHAALTSVMTDVAALPRSLQPPRDLWPEIEARLAEPLSEAARADLERRLNGQADRPPVSPPARRFRLKAWHGLAIAAVLAVVAVSAFWLIPQLFPPAWDVARLEGTPRIGQTQLTETGLLRQGEWLETDDHARATIEVGVIGNVEVAPNTRLQLVDSRASNHRLALTEGAIHARIWAPPRLFFVETPSALAIDLGCEYTLQVDSTGGSLLHVTSGYVELQHGERTAVVPAGSMCLTRPGQGPGTPFDEEASEAFREALARLDFDDGGLDALADVLAEAEIYDVATLWRLMYKLEGEARSRLYDGLVALVEAPEGITRDATLRADLDAIEAWDRHLGLDFDDGWFFRLFKKKKQQAP